MPPELRGDVDKREAALRIVMARQVRQRCGDSHFHLQRDVADKRQHLEVFEGLASVKAPIVVNMTHAGVLRSALCKSRLDS